uniref:Ribonuclease P protein subunit p29 n=1 Tax=Macaca fascicularis TaxID=9541 RepID=A0A7N9CWD8_MACFA
MIQAKLLKADLHGAVISVTKSKCPSYVGITGILLQETKHIFKIITKEDRLKACRDHRLLPWRPQEACVSAASGPSQKWPSGGKILAVPQGTWVCLGARRGPPPAPRLLFPEECSQTGSRVETG